MAEIDRKIAEKLDWKFYLEEGHWSRHIDNALALAAKLKLIYRIEQDFARHDADEPLVVLLYEPDNHRLVASFGASRVNELAEAVAAAILAWLEAQEAER